MKFNRIRLSNVRSYVRQEIEFPEGCTLFAGDIGSGKSTILMAMEFALFGLGADDGQALLGVNRQKGFVELEFEAFGNTYAIHRGLARKGNSVVQEACTLTTGGVMTHFTPRELKAKVLEILRFNEPPTNSESKIFRYSIFTPQEEMKIILSINQDARLQILRKAFGIEDYKIAASNIADISRYMRQKSSEILSQAFDLEEKTAKLEDGRKKLELLDQDIGNLSRHVDAIQKRLSAAREEHDGYRRSLESMEAKREQHAKIMRELAGKQNNLKRLDERKRMQESSIGKKTAFIKQQSESIIPSVDPESLKAKITVLQGEFSSMTSRKGEVLERIKNLTSSRQRTQKDLETNRNDLASLVKRKEAEEERIREKRAFIEERSAAERPDGDPEAIGSEIAALQKSLFLKATESGTILAKVSDYSEILSNGTCPTCERPVEDPATFGSRLTSREKAYEVIEGEMGELSARLETLQKARERAIVYRGSREETKRAAIELKQISKSLESTLESIEKQNQRILEKLQEIEAMDRAITEANLSVQSQETELRKLNNQIRSVEKEKETAITMAMTSGEIRRATEDLDRMNSDLSEIGREMESITEEMEDLSREATKLSADLQSMDSLRSRADSAKQQVDREEALLGQERRKLGEAEGSRNQLREVMASLREEVDLKSKMRQRSAEILEYVSWLDQFLLPTIDLVEKNAMVSLNNEFNENIQTIFGMLVDDPGKNIRVDEAFTPIVEQDGIAQEISYLSGGERTSVALAYRLTLNRMVKRHLMYSDRNPLILDEPTDGFSRDQLLKIREILEMMEASQVIIVSHEKDMESFADQIYRVNKLNGNSTVAVA